MAEDYLLGASDCILSSASLEIGDAAKGKNDKIIVQVKDRGVGMSR